MFESSLIILTVAMLLVCVAPFLPSNHWLSRVWEFPRVQISVICLVLIIVSFFVASLPLKIVLIGLNSASLLYQFFWILPYTKLYPIQVKKTATKQSSPSIKILTSNVLMPNHASDKLIALIDQYQPDVIVTLETDLWWENALKGIHEAYPYRVNKPLDNLYGMHLYSKYRLEDIQILNLVEEDIPSMHGYLVLDNGVKVKCHFIHPAPPSPTENETSTPRDKELLIVAKQVAKTTEPTIVTGDLNDVAWSPTTRTFRHVSGLKDPRIGRGMFNTFHASYPILRWPLDHIFHSEHFTLGSLKRMPSIGSDHFPLLSELIYNEEVLLPENEQHPK
ncbi:endonuclease/exonuclease/phosphatase family protein [Psychromonas aquatilis]|uniref:Endonuclease/exonuclease/phosphatase family protein n=1 Tax=Psychromonas aquatilis TaxID=2005072 RepID=A0ABU9GLZ2_9GAMM